MAVAVGLVAGFAAPASAGCDPKVDKECQPVPPKCDPKVDKDCKPDPPKKKCNAGRGNASETTPANDCDPGNSAGHNNGGD